MVDYMERETAIKAIEKADCAVIADDAESCKTDYLREIIKSVPAADVAPVVRGRWAHLGGDEWCCPVCGFVITTEGSWDKPTKKYCEDCGAKMDGGDNTER